MFYSYLRNVLTWLLNGIDDKIVLVTGVVTRGEVLLFEIGVYWDAKKALKLVAFSLTFDVSSYVD